MTDTLEIQRLHQLILITLLSSIFGVIDLTDAMCGKPGRASNCRHLDNKTEYEVGEKVRYICSDCFTKDRMDRQCLQNGSWSGRLPVCHNFLPLENVKKLSLINSKIKDANWSMDTDPETCSREAVENGTFWEAVLKKPFPISVIKVVFPESTRVYARVQIKERNRSAKTCESLGGSGRTFFFECTSSAADSVRIIQDGTVFQLCEVTLHIKPSFANCLRPDSPYMASGQKHVFEQRPTEYIFQCNEDYELVGKGTVACQADGTWAPSSTKCKKTHCGQLPSIANGFLRVSTTTVNSTAFLECNEGFRPLSNDRIHCLPTLEWTLKSLSCEPIYCDSNPTIRHGKGVLLDSSFILGSKLHIICDRGYTAIESVLRECHENSTWGYLDICVENNCGPLNAEVSDSGNWISLNGTISIKVLICEDGHYIEGSPAVTQCLPDGSWSYTTAVCRRSPITDGWRSEWEPSTLLMSAVAIGVGTAICILSLVSCFFVMKKRKQSKTNTAVFHVGVEDSLYTDGTKEQQYKNTYEDVIELRNKSYNTKPRKPSSALPHIPIDADPVYAQPFETAEVTKTETVNTTDLYTAHIYAEPVNSHVHDLRQNVYNSAAETWLRSGAKKFGRKMSLPGRPSLSEDAMQQTSLNIAVCKPVFHSNMNSMNAIFDESCEKNEFEPKRPETFELINNSIYSDEKEKSFSSGKDIEQFQMIDNEIYQDDYFTNV